MDEIENTYLKHVTHLSLFSIISNKNKRKRLQCIYNYFERSIKKVLLLSDNELTNLFYLVFEFILNSN